MSLKRVVLAENCLEPSTWESYEVEDVCSFLKDHFGKWPETGRIYHTQVAAENDVTPTDAHGIDRLAKMEGDFWCVIYPQGPITIILIAVAVLALAVVAVIFLAPKTAAPVSIARSTNPGAANRRQKSSNNELSDRQNGPRINGRIPDIYGTVRATPDLLTAPYTIFINNVEIEYSYMCVGRGEYDISDIKDDTILISEIAGSSVEVYAPFKSPNLNDTPQIQIGDPIDSDALLIKRVSAVNGQTLRPPNDVFVQGFNDITFMFPNEIHTSNPDYSFSDKFEPGDNIVITNASVSTHQVTPSLTVTRDFGGTYVVTSISDSAIVVNNPSAVNSAWLNFTDTVAGSPLIAINGDRWVGPFIVEMDVLSYFITNVVATNGMYLDDGFTQTRIDVDVDFEYTAIDEAGNILSAPFASNGTIIGSAVSRDARAVTIRGRPPITNNRYKVRAKRRTPTNTGFAGSVADEIKWRDLYMVQEILPQHFGNITTVLSATYATTGALAVKERKLNMLASRKIKTIQADYTLSSTLSVSSKASDILANICIDEYIGNRNVAEINLPNFKATAEEVADYFGTDVAQQFNYTIDDDNLSFEETVGLIADAMFCTAYRRGSQINVFFEKETEDSVLLFNHRNKVPGSETRTIVFGNNNDNDGIEYDYTSPVDDAVLTYYIPEDQSAANPKRIEGTGVRSKIQAHFHAYRLWNKIQYQNIATEFGAMEEAVLVIPGERVLVADNTRQETQDGEIVAQDGLVVTTSQDVVFEDGVDYTIYLQLANGTVDNIDVTAADAPNRVLLATPPSKALVIDSDRYARTTYAIVGNNDNRHIAFLVNEKDPLENKTLTLRAGNYDSRFYERDTDYINGLITEESPSASYNGPFVIYIAFNGSKLDLRDYADQQGYQSGNCNYVFYQTFTTTSDDPLTPAVNTGNWPAGITLNIEIRSGAAITGASGGDAFYCAATTGITLNIDNNGIITGSGGGNAINGLSHITLLDGSGSVVGPTI